MYDISMPIIVTAKTYERERVLEDLRLMGAKRVFLAMDFLTHNKDVMDGYYAKIRPEIEFFKSHGFEVGVWFWTFRFDDREPKYTETVHALGQTCHTTTIKYCPFDEGYLNFMANHVRTLAAMHPDLIMFDDDLAFGFTSMKAPSCFCALHRGKMAEYLDEEIMPAEGLYERLFSGKPNRYRSAFLRANGEALRNFARRMRQAVDSVDPTVRMGQCGCITTFDYDGVDSFTLSKLLAGNTKPFLRLIGAPYWDPVRLHGNYLCDVIELERMERAWYDGNDMEIFSEGDTYPRPRHRVPASYLEIFDAALRADGNLNGILKYVLCYANHADYERGYINAHLKNLGDQERIGQTFAGLSDAGVRLYESMQKIEQADYSEDVLTMDLIRYQFFSRGERFLAHNSIPIAHRGRGCGGLAFGENARHLDDGAFDRPLILDAPAARILQERGIDVGVDSFGGRFIPAQEHYLKTDEYETIPDCRLKPPFAALITPKSGAKVLSEWLPMEGGETVPASYTYQNAHGQQFLVLCMDAFTCADEIYKNYSRQGQLLDFLRESGCNLPAACGGNPELYLLCKSDENSLAIGFFNCFADCIDDFTTSLTETYQKAEFYRCEGSLSGRSLHLKHLSAYDWCFVKLTK